MSAAVLLASTFSVAVSAQTSEQLAFKLLDSHDVRQEIADDYELLKDGVSLTYYQGNNEQTNENYKGEAIQNPTGQTTETDPDWFVFDFGSNKYFEKISIQWQNDCRAVDYTISVSENKEDWTLVASVTKSGAVVYDNFFITDPLHPAYGRYLKINVTKNDRKDYRPHINGMKVQRQRIPTTIELSANGGPLYFIGSDNAKNIKLSIVVKDQLGKIMTPIREIKCEMLTENAGNLTLDEGQTVKENYTFVPAENFIGNAIFHVSCGPASTDLALAFVKSDSAYPHGAISGSSSAAEDVSAGNKVIGNLFDGEKIHTTDHTGSAFRWKNNGTVTDVNEEHFVIAELSTPWTVNAVSLRWGGAPASYSIYLSRDGVEYTPVVTDYSKTAPNTWYDHAVIPFVAKYIKIETKGYQTTDYGLDLSEIELYGEGYTQVATSVAVKSSEGTALATGDETYLSAAVLDQYGIEMEGGEVTWTASMDGGNTFGEYTGSGKWDSKSGYFKAGEGVAGKGVTFRATLKDDKPEEQKIKGDILLKGFDFDHYVFDAKLHKNYREDLDGLNLADIAAKAVITSHNDPDKPRPDGKLLFDGGQNKDSHGGIYDLLKTNSQEDEEGLILVKLYDPVTIEAIILRWEAALPKEYKVEISNHGQVWEPVATYKDLEFGEAGVYVNHRMVARYDKPITMIRISTKGAVKPGYGVRLADIKVYGLYSDVKPAALTLNPYVNVEYTYKEGDQTFSPVHDHPNTVTFYSNDKSHTQYDGETVYLNPVFKTVNKADLRVGKRKIAYEVERISNEESDGTPGYELDEANHTISFSQPGKYKVTGTYTPAEEGAEAITGSTILTAVHHYYQLTADYIPSTVTLMAQDGSGVEHSENTRAKELLMKGRNNFDGGVDGSVNLYNNDKVFDAVFDFGYVIDVPAIEVYWEGACPASYSISYGREADFSDAVTIDHKDDTRVAMVNRPRFDRFAVETTAGYTKDAAREIMSRAEGDGNEAEQTPKEPEEGSTQAIRYVKVHNVVLDPYMGKVWGAKLAEVTPYYDPEISSTLPTGIETIDTDSNVNAPVEYYNLQGRRINAPMAGQIVIRRQGTTVSKILVK